MSCGRTPCGLSMDGSCVICRPITVRLGDELNSIIVENFPALIEPQFEVRIPITAEQAQRLGFEVPS